MPYKRNLRPIYRRYPYYSYANREKNAEEELLPDGMKKISEIPLPNEVETPQKSQNPHMYRTGISSILSSLARNIRVEDIILIGLILLILDEGFEDDFLLFMLIFIFFGG